jgi:hypothetical protein
LFRLRFAGEAHLARLFAGAGDGGDDRLGGEAGLVGLPVTLTEAARADPAERAADRHDWDRRDGPARSHADERALPRTDRVLGRISRHGRHP